MELCWGIAAAGRITHDFVTALNTLPNGNHKIIAIADPEIQRAIDFANKHQIKKHYGSYDELANDPNIGIIYIGTINPFHYNVCKLFLQHGKNVLCEKPLCMSYTKAEELYQLAYIKNVFLLEGIWSRFFPSYKYLNELIELKSIGDIKEIHVEHGFKADIDRILTRKLGGGITMDIGIYSIQLAQLIFKGYPKKIKAIGKLNDDGIDLESNIELDFGNDCKLYAHTSGLKNLKNQAIIKGTKGEILLKNYWCCDSIVGPDGKIKEFPLPEGKFPFNHFNSCGLRYEAEEVRNCLEKGLKESPLYTWKNSLEMIAIEDEIRRQLGVFYDF
ncbi:trans-1,2-dihydrobenzene-1,2-diol dehydrogenase [Condylostylus longicornis]|uniref:trans-1,2-dihydrobenzene-1,2-diol dehydrogenase n=1 Tax=Condylostylus longicornis TaxID=2530218 RepID=UPI00244DD0B6|nr:trans-1,2-dihydrobenzene-1,2-diol dehydrogenase [Condylostylus longicornis]